MAIGFDEDRDKELHQRALDMAAEAKSEGRKLRLEPLNAYERRVVHLALKDDEGKTVESMAAWYRYHETLGWYIKVPLPQDLDDIADLRWFDDDGEHKVDVTAVRQIIPDPLHTP